MVMLVASLYDWLMFFHIVAAMVWVGGLVTLALLATQALRGDQPDNVARFVRSLRLIGPMFGPAMVLVLGLGIWMVIDSDAWTFGQGLAPLVVMGDA